MKISALVPVYNTDPSHLREMIDSILGQTYRDFELLILNDSPDNAHLADIVKSYADPRIKYFANKRNMGISASRNKLIGLASGEYLAICDHDDISMPDRFAQQAAYLDKHPDIGAVGGWVRHFGDHSFVVKYRPDNPSIKGAMVMDCALPHPASMIRKSILLDNDIRYEEKYSPAEDYMLMCRLMEFAEFHNIQKVLLRYRDFGGNASHRQANRMAGKDFEVKMFVQNKYPVLFARRAEFGVLSQKLKLFGIPFIKYKKSGNRAKIHLFWFIPIMTIYERFKIHEITRTAD